MSKKKINKRLDSLFEEIKSNEADSQLERSGKNGARTLKQTASLPSLPVRSLNRVSEALQESDITVRPEGSQETAKIQPSPSAILSTAVRFDEKNWSTIKIVDESGEGSWGAEEQLLVKQVADQLSLAMENARLFQETQQRVQELTTLLNASQNLAKLPLQLDEIATLIAQYFVQIFQVTECSILLLTPQGKMRAIIDYIPDEKMGVDDKPWTGVETDPADYPATLQMLATLQPVILEIGDYSLDDAEWDYMQKFGVKTQLLLPLILQGKPIGMIHLEELYEEKYFSQQELNLAIILTNQAAVALENARLFQEEKNRAEEIGALNQIILSSSQTLELSQLLDTLLLQILSLYEFKCGLISLFNENSGDLELFTQRGLPAPIMEQLSTTGLQGSLCEYVFLNHTPLALSDVRVGSPIDASGLIANNLLAYLGVPLETKGRVIGTLCLFSEKPEPLPVRIVDLTQTIGRQIGFAIENALLFQRTQQSESEFKALFSAMEDAIIVYSREGRYERIAETNPNFLYQPSAEMLGKTIQEVLPKNLHEPFLSTIQTTLDTGESQNIEYPLKINEQEFWFYASVSKLTEDHVFWVARDITERKKNEQALRRQNEYLAATSEIVRLVTSSLELNAIFSRAVNLVKERFGYYHAAIFIVEETGFQAVLQEGTGEAGEIMKQRAHSLAVGSRSTVGQATETRKAIVINDVTLDPVHKPNPLLPDTRAEAAIPLRIGNRIIGVLDIQSKVENAFSDEDIAILQMMTDQIAIGIDNARSYTIAQQAVQEMREVDRLKSQFLANMSHELRTPLNSIIGFARVIIKGIDGPVTELQQQDLSAIYNAGQHLLGLINDILDQSRIEAGKMDLTFDEVNISDLINSVMSTAAGLVKDKPIVLKREIAESLPTIRADPMRVRQILINLLSNAAKFTDSGEIIVKAEIERTHSAGDAFVMVSVTDTGPGISTEDQAKLFQAFSQVDSSLTRKVGGSGLGLSICHHLVQMHNGLIGVNSTLGQGSTFYFTIPIFTNEHQALQSVNKTILAIDDDPQILNLYERYLHPKGFQVISLNDPSRARERARRLRPYAIVLDIMMPGYDGWLVIQDLKSDPDTRNIPIIISSILEEEEKGFSLGATDYLLKPIVEEDLLASLDRINNGGNIREVLIIDDDPNDLRLLGTIIGNQGRYKPILAEGGPAGWNAIQSKKPHAIVLDLLMPEIDGFSILEKLHENHELKDIPVVVVSNNDLTIEQHKHLQALGQRMLQKSSLHERELIASIENALEQIHH